MHISEKEVNEGKFFAVISYISFLCIIALLLKKENKFALYHAKHGLVLFAFESAAWVLSAIPLIGILMRTLGFAVFVLVSLWGVFQALSGNCGRLPGLTDIAQKIVI